MSFNVKLIRLYCTTTGTEDQCIRAFCPLFAVPASWQSTPRQLNSSQFAWANPVLACFWCQLYLIGCTNCEILAFRTSANHSLVHLRINLACVIHLWPFCSRPITRKLLISSLFTDHLWTQQYIHLILPDFSLKRSYSSIPSSQRLLSSLLKATSASWRPIRFLTPITCLSFISGHLVHFWISSISGCYINF